MMFYILALVVLSFEKQHSAQAFVQTTQQSQLPSKLCADSAINDFARFEATLQEDAATEATQSKEAFNWQADLEKALNPTTSNSQRQLLLSELIQNNSAIRVSVQKALRDRNIDPILTPTGRRLQDGTKAVARQLTRDILPSLVSRESMPTADNLPTLQDVGKTNQRFLGVLQQQFESNLETFQKDMADPSRIADRLKRQSETVLQEASNIFAETPSGITELPYTVAYSCEDYEIREYPAHMAVSTDVDPTALARLTSYVVGANAEHRFTGWSVPIVNTGTEIRFACLGSHQQQLDGPPSPLQDDDAVSDDTLVFKGIRIASIPAARLAVRRFTGFITAGEVARQKQELLTALSFDDVTLDIPHGTTVGHLVLEYNPPYTIPVVRRNEIAVPVLEEEDL